MHRNNVHLLHPISYLEYIWCEFFGIFLLLLSRLQTAATGQTGVNACILGHLHQRAQCDAAVAGLQTVGKLLVALLALVARVERADGVISLASLFAQRGTGKRHANPVGIVCRNVPASLGKWSVPSSSTPASATRIISIKVAGKIKVLVVNNRK